MSEQSLGEMRRQLQYLEDRLDDQPAYDTRSALRMQQGIELLISKISERERKTLQPVIAERNQEVLPFCRKLRESSGMYLA